MIEYKRAHMTYQYYTNRTEKKYLQYVYTYQESFTEVVIGNIHSNSFLLLYNFEAKYFHVLLFCYHKTTYQIDVV